MIDKYKKPSKTFIWSKEIFTECDFSKINVSVSSE